MNNTELYHYGVLGMRWGRRKSSSNMSSDAAEAKRLKKKKVDEMSNDEIGKLNKRQQLEQQHKQLNPGKIAKGLLIAGAIAAALGTITKLYRNSKESVNIGREVAGKYKNAKVNRLNKAKIQEALGKGAVLKRSNSSALKINTKNLRKPNISKIKVLKGVR